MYGDYKNIDLNACLDEAVDLPCHEIQAINNLKNEKINESNSFMFSVFVEKTITYCL
jgi:hypothetical protein